MLVYEDDTWNNHSINDESLNNFLLLKIMDYRCWYFPTHHYCRLYQGKENLSYADLQDFVSSTMKKSDGHVLTFKCKDMDNNWIVIDSTEELQFAIDNCFQLIVNIHQNSNWRMKFIPNLVVVSLLILLVAVGWSANFSLLGLFTQQSKSQIDNDTLLNNRIDALTSVTNEKLNAFDDMLDAFKNKFDERAESVKRHVDSIVHEMDEKWDQHDQDHNKLEILLKEFVNTFTIKLKTLSDTTNFQLEASKESIDKKLDTFSGKLEALHGKLDKEERLEPPVAHVINQQQEEHEKLVAPSKERNKTSPMITETWADTINRKMDAVPTKPNYEKLGASNGILGALHHVLSREKERVDFIQRAISREHERHDRHVTLSKELNRTIQMKSETLTDTTNCIMDDASAKTNNDNLDVLDCKFDALHDTLDTEQEEQPVDSVVRAMNADHDQFVTSKTSTRKLVELLANTTKHKMDVSTKATHEKLDAVSDKRGAFNIKLDLKIKNLPPYTLHSLDDPLSAQSRAYHWLENDPMVHTYHSWRKRQRFALATLFFSTNGQHWHHPTSWLQYQTHECHWYTKSRSTPCWRGKYETVHLDSNNLHGSLPAEMALLTSMKFLYLEGNSLTGTIPTEIGTLTALQESSFKRNNLVGTIPTEIGILTALESIWFDNNHFVGTIPTEIGTLTALHKFSMSRNSFVGTIPTEIGTLTALETFWLFNNNFVGTVPTEIGNLLTLRSMNFANNSFTGTIPELGGLTALSSLDLRRNDLSGDYNSI